MNQKTLAALVGANLILGGALVWRLMPSNAAVAQVGNAQRPGECVLTPGEVTGATDATVYVLDTTNGVLGGMSYDSSLQRMTSIPPINLQRVFDAAGSINGQGAAPAPRQPRR